MIMDGTFAVAPIRAKKIRALAVTTDRRIPTLPDVPTMGEAGIANYEFSPWWAAYVPTGTPPAIVAKLSGWIRQISSTEETRAFLERIASIPLAENPEETAAHLQSDIQKWGPIVAAAKLEPQ
jgi:tripartite-type tricarboxylate transporter receptor subunit TctC